MNNYVTGKIIKELRENKQMTQLDLANILKVSDKTISKWETGKGLPDISIIDSLAQALGVSIIELMHGEYVTNKNISCNMLNSNLYVCPICGNVLTSIGESIVSCCGITLPKLEAENENTSHTINCELVEDEYFVTLNHEMSKKHYISFIAYVTQNKFEFVKLYPEQNAEARFFNRGKGIIYAFCNKDSLIKKYL